ncbi:MAG TPA: pantetheine-phosphate adenylyltransferase [Bacteroidales bacterium]|jgi:pantetheine-phosphate adenylyltransferase|nr:pantetheine-phosphate adenylyltransferase [Bacteroidales bacterium]HPT09879.1 pantetheine-phosphate adenylyltransferase [Bacteroidales bacterium]
MNRTAVFPGSFDPVTRGHLSVIRRALPLFDHLTIAIGTNAGKTAMFPLETRKEWLLRLFAGEPRITIAAYSGLTVDFCRKINAGYLLRGLRSSADFEFEKGIAQMNQLMAPEIETIFLLCDLLYAPISSSIVRDILRNGGDVSRFIPEGISIPQTVKP